MISKFDATRHPSPARGRGAGARVVCGGLTARAAVLSAGAIQTIMRAVDQEEPRWHTRNVPAARRLRKPLTATEDALWHELRGRRFLGLKFRRQHPIGAYVLDFWCDELQLAVEVDGGIHNAGAVAERDRGRQRALEELGVRFVRVPASLVEHNLPAALGQLAEAVADFR